MNVHDLLVLLCSPFCPRVPYPTIDALAGWLLSDSSSSSSSSYLLEKGLPSITPFAHIPISGFQPANLISISFILFFHSVPSPPRHHQPPSRRSRSVVIFPLPTYAVFCRTSLAPSHQGIDPCTATHQLPYPGLANIVTSKFGRRTAYP